MDNSAALRMGTMRAKDVIKRHILNGILIPLADGLIQEVTEGRISIGHNMTGNTVNSYAAGIYVSGQLVYIKTSSESIPKPLRRKLGKGERFYAGSIRWDEEMQESTFTANVSTNGTTEAERSIAFLRSYRPSPNGWELVVCNGVEYAAYQENEMKIDVLTANLNYAKMFALSMFKPMTD